jgi:hypothetical protein
MRLNPKPVSLCHQVESKKSPGCNKKNVEMGKRVKYRIWIEEGWLMRQYHHGIALFFDKAIVWRRYIWV